MFDRDRLRAVLGRVIAAPEESLGDGELLERYVARRDGAAFETLVRRHGKMVLAVCRRVTGHQQDAEDAFQATFLVLARKAVSVRPRCHVGNWLYGVAYRIALKARERVSRARTLEHRVSEARGPMSTSPPDQGEEIRCVLDEELARLPDRYRVAVVLCDLEGRPRKEVAGELGIPEGTLSSRLTGARKLLAARLTRRGLTLPAAGLGVVLSEPASTAGPVPPALIEAAVRGAEPVAPAVRRLADEVLRSSAPPAWPKIAGLVFLAAVLGAAGLVAGGTSRPESPLAEPPAPRAPSRVPGSVRADHPGLRRHLETAKWELSALDPERRTATVRAEAFLALGGANGRPTVLEAAGFTVQGLTIERGATVELDHWPVELDALRPGMSIVLDMRSDRLTVDRIIAVSTQPPRSGDAGCGYELFAIAPVTGAISVRDTVTRLVLEDLPLARDVQIERAGMEGNNPIRFINRPGTVQDLKSGMRVALTLAIGPDGRIAVGRVATPE